MAPSRSRSRPSPGPTTAEVVAAAFDRSVAQLRLELPRVRRDEGAEAVHQARVATRRLRSDLRTFRPVLEREWADALRTSVRPLTDLLGVVRDADVLDARLARDQVWLASRHAPALAALRERLGERRSAAWAELIARLATPDTEALLDVLVTAAVEPRVRPDLADRPAAETLLPLVAGPWRRLERAVRHLGPDPTDADLHSVRILAKRCRYAAEAADPATGGRARRFARAAAALQDRLGEWHDAVAAAEWLEAVAPELTGEHAFAAGLVAAAELDDAARRRAAWEPAWRRLAAPKRRRFLADLAPGADGPC